ncbi:acyl-CoA synthetase [Nocardioides eburneiflavus]|uniref:Acyl-CoA synthetase n=1 Tax=Nocardioides eburneiflavus TaxID=2518372 RepID=A0A4Z1CKG1_9ACTN|nr:AMP-binding protein [Nocardioides eburneiflavus]TGN65253.1 acyl-CoA synthetase [Nocardioides eburneiflavus]
MTARDLSSSLAARASGVATTLGVLGSAGVIRPYGPRTLVDIGRVVLRWGTGPAGGFATLAARAPHQVGVVDELGELTWGELHRRSNSLARALSERGVREGDSVAVMCRNHRGFVDASIAVAKLGADILYLNTAFAGPQLVDVLEREAPSLVVHDEEFTALLAGARVERRVLAWTDGDPGSEETLERLVSAHDESDLHPPQRHARIVILTSGTTGAPKGAPRKEAGIDAAVSLLSRMPLRAGWRTHVAAPLFHTWGFAHLALAMLLGSTVVLRRTFDPEAALRTAQDERCQSMVVIPVMIQRMLALDPEVLDGIDLSRVEVVASSGSALPATLARAWMDRFGDNLYNIYGSTEVAYASIATPEDLRADPTSAGKPPYGTVVKILDEAGSELPPGETGRIFVGNGLLFEGYTNGGSKEVVDGLMSSGDVGYYDEAGRLHVAGRDDDMIVSGGENVFPQEVEDCLVTHEQVGEVAAIGVSDEDYGQRLRAFVVRTGEVSEDELRDHVRANLARFKVPREIVFLDELPRNATGKILKRELAEWDRAKDEATTQKDGEEPA